MKRTALPFRAAAWFGPVILFALAFGAPCFGQAPITEGLVARWSGDGNAKDSAGHSDGQVSGGVGYVPGPAGQAFQFDGGSAKVDFGPAAGNFGARDFTIACWMKSDCKNRHEAFLAKRASCDGASSFWEVRIGGPGYPDRPSGSLVFCMEAGDHTDSNNLLSSHPMNDGLWHHVAWVRQSTSSGTINCLIYVDGALDNSKVFVGAARDNPRANPDAIDLANQSPLLLGQNVCQCCDGTTPYSGAAAELQLFSHALSAEEILTIYQAGKSRQ